MLAATGDHMADEVQIESRDFWVKVVDMLQQNWALVDDIPERKEATAYFIHDQSGVFDRLPFRDRGQAERALERNGFRRYLTDAQLQSFLRPPEPPFTEGVHSNGKIYSSGRFWKHSGAR